MALRFDIEEKDYQLDLLDTIREGLVYLMKAQGAKVKFQRHKPLLPPIKSDEIPLVDDLLQKLGSQTGTIIVRGKK